MAIKKSIIRRYLIWSLLASAVPVIWVGLLYDRFAESAFQTVINDKLAVQLTATSSRLSAFLDARRYQIETLANFPGINQFAATQSGAASQQVGALLQVESDLPDLFGILFFSSDEKLQQVIPGQAASGPPYWSDTKFQITGLPRMQVGETDLIGPAPPQDGEAGWLLLRHPLREPQAGGHSSGHVALHVRLASLTELMGNDTAGGTLKPILKTPAGYFNSVGLPVKPAGKLVPGPEIVPGWQPMLQVDASALAAPFDRMRRALFIAVVVGAILIVLLFYRMSISLRQRVRELLTGAQAISTGRLEYRIADSGQDEIATVSRAFDAMAANLEMHLARIVKMEKMAVLGEFATLIAHEVRNPLAAVKTSVQALARREKDPRRLQLLDDMESEIDRLARVVSQLLDFGRPRPAQVSDVAVREVFRRITLLLGPQGQARGVSLSAQGDSDLVLRADFDHVVQVLMNLVINAIQACDQGGAVVLRASRVNDMAALEVSDTGHGIPAGLLPRVTDPFYSTKTKGMGLGLSISRQLTEMNGGRLDIQSKPGSGTSVSVYFPLNENQDGQHTDH
ncbi:two-component system sensor histidine kinase AtoS [Paucimonas lemoignei]|uniref:histidine kinase n=1 Tax=Paucimonas lemoignei TaxID=29443 RepID=A0A4R3HXX8_PAULE|nr:HAMP domain-containing sensor histidine kinase [Paucimonas lemoignei]TCS37065.1 two-component system sensor histidine kinase AtoS [Paucimonas lemoignei]